jgi:hypothetical protein
MAFSNMKVSKFSSDYLELRIKGAGKTGKGDRTELLSASDARILAYTLLAEAERLSTPTPKRTKDLTQTPR